MSCNFPSLLIELNFENFAKCISLFAVAFVIPDVVVVVVVIFCSVVVVFLFN